MRILIFIMIFAFAALQPATTQTSGGILQKLQAKNGDGGSVTIHQSANIRNVLLLHLDARKKNIENNGYRICIFSDSGQEANRKAENVRSVFMGRYPDIEPYKIFNTPFWRVYVGDFKIKSEAMKFLKRLERNFPNAYIVPYVISLSVLN